MASVSLSLNRGADNQPDKVLVGTLAISASDVELRIDQTKNLTRTEMLDILDAFKRKIEDGRFAGLTGV